MKNERKTSVILGIDPGTNVTGYGVVRVAGDEVACVELGCIDLHRSGDAYEKLHGIFTGVCSLIDRYRPDHVAFESLFFGENVQSMLKLGRAQGVAMAAALSKGCTVAEYAPRRVKESITGRGAAAKEQVAAILKNILKLDALPAKLDATDGLAVAMCHYFNCRSEQTFGAAEKKKALGGGRKNSGDWNDFIRKNPGRIK